MTSSKKDTVLMVGGGGMAGIFSSGVLEVFEDEQIRDRVHSVYAVSVGGPVVARYLMRQSAFGARTFLTRFSDDRFLKKRFAKYFFQAVRKGFFPSARIDEMFDFDYFRHVILSSHDRIDMKGLIALPTPFFVKVFNNTKKTHEYLPVREPYAYEKVMASASITPITSKAPIINGVEYFDGDTISSDIDLRIAKEHADKTIVRIVNSKRSLFDRMNFLVPTVIYILFLCLYGAESANRYLRAYFKKAMLERELRSQLNVLVVESDLRTSPFCKDKVLLEKAYQNGRAKGVEAVRRLSR